MNVLQTQFDISVKVDGAKTGERGDKREEERGRRGDESKVCDSVTHNVQFNAKCQMIS